MCNTPCDEDDAVTGKARRTVSTNAPVLSFSYSFCFAFAFFALVSSLLHPSFGSLHQKER